MREALRNHPDVVGVSPIVAGTAIKGPLADLLRHRGTEVSPAGVASLYEGLCNRFVIDESDAATVDAVRTFIPDVVVAPTVMDNADSSERLAKVLLT